MCNTSNALYVGLLQCDCVSQKYSMWFSDISPNGYESLVQILHACYTLGYYLR